jgi:hypothetical protein
MRVHGVSLHAAGILEPLVRSITRIPTTSAAGAARPTPVPAIAARPVRTVPTLTAVGTPVMTGLHITNNWGLFVKWQPSNLPARRKQRRGNKPPPNRMRGLFRFVERRSRHVRQGDDQVLRGRTLIGTPPRRSRGVRSRDRGATEAVVPVQSVRCPYLLG